jgi:pantoate--beta-alanine ligase
MITITDLEELRRQVAVPHGAGRTVAFVPTMGFLHDGHLSLVRRARRLGAFSVVSVFVNPSQFGPGEDLERYPRDLERDAALLAGLDVDILFVPEARDVYPEDFGTWVGVDDVTQGLCGASRPVHFRGVATVVVKLLNMVQPDVAYFGRKDFQQLRVIEKAVRDLNMMVSIKGCPTVRDADGMALSSRNAYLTDEERARARTIPSVLAEAARRHAQGTRQAGEILEGLPGRLEEAADSVDYFGLYDATTLQPVDDKDRVPDEPLLALAVHVGRTRLIDNIQLGVDDPPDV